MKKQAAFLLVCVLLVSAIGPCLAEAPVHSVSSAAELADCVAGLTEDSTVCLLADIEEKATVCNDKDITVTIDGNSHALLNGLDIVNNGSCNWAWLMVGNKYLTDKQILRSCPAKNKNNAAYYALNKFASTVASRTYSTNGGKQTVFWKFAFIRYPSLTVFFADAKTFTDVCYHSTYYTDKRPDGRHNSAINAVRMAGNVTSMAPREYLKDDPWSKYQ